VHSNKQGKNTLEGRGGPRMRRENFFAYLFP